MEISICNSFWTAWTHKGKLLSKFAVAVVISTEGWNKDAQREAHPIVPEYHELPTTIVAMEYFAALLLSDWDHWVLPIFFKEAPRNTVGHRWKNTKSERESMFLVPLKNETQNASIAEYCGRASSTWKLRSVTHCGSSTAIWLGWNHEAGVNQWHATLNSWAK